MMLYPTVQELTNENVNRYGLVIATAKCARHIIDKANEARELEEARRLDTDRFSKESKNENDILLTDGAPEDLIGNHLLNADELEAMEERKTALLEEIEMLRATARDYRSRFQRLVEDQQHVLNAETELFE